MEQAPIPSSHRPATFHGFDSEDINRWIDKVENYLKLRRINMDSPTPFAELIVNLDTFNKFIRDALRARCLRARFANENQSWLIWQDITNGQ